MQNGLHTRKRKVGKRYSWFHKSSTKPVLGSIPTRRKRGQSKFTEHGGLNATSQTLGHPLSWLQDAHEVKLSRWLHRRAICRARVNEEYASSNRKYGRCPPSKEKVRRDCKSFISVHMFPGWDYACNFGAMIPMTRGTLSGHRKHAALILGKAAQQRTPKDAWLPKGRWVSRLGNWTHFLSSVSDFSPGPVWW